MARQNKPSSQRNKNNLPPEVTQEFLQQFLQMMQDMNTTEQQRINLQKLDLEISKHLAEKQLDYNADLIRNYPGEKRKTVQRYTVLALVSLVVVSAICFVFLKYGFDEFLIQAGTGLGALATLYVTFKLGQKSGNKQSPDPFEPEDAEIVE